MVGLRLLSRRAVRAPRACLALTGSVGVASAAASFAGTGALVDAIGAGAAASVLLSARRLSPRVPWLLLAAAPALFVAADVVGGDDATFVGGARASASVADAAYLGAYAALAAGVMLLVRRRSSGGDWAALIDSLAVATGVSLLAWIFLVAPRAHERVLPLDDKLLAIAFPLLDVLLVAAVARLAIRDGARSGSFFLLSGGIGAFLATDTVLRLFRLHGWHEPGGLLDGGWIASFVLLAAAALHPSARTLAEPVPEEHPAGERRRVGLLGGSAGVVAVATGWALWGIVRYFAGMDLLFYAGERTSDGVSANFPNRDHFATYANLAFLVVAARLGQRLLQPGGPRLRFRTALSDAVAYLLERRAPWFAVGVVLLAGSLGSTSRGGFLSLLVAFGFLVMLLTGRAAVGLGRAILVPVAAAGLVLAAACQPTAERGAATGADRTSPVAPASVSAPDLAVTSAASTPATTTPACPARSRRDPAAAAAAGQGRSNSWTASASSISGPAASPTTSTTSWPAPSKRPTTWVLSVPAASLRAA
jgi:hypothetical protein